MYTQSQVSSIISCLTNDDDLRQELWVYYLSGNPVELFSEHLRKLKMQYSQDIELRDIIWNMIRNPIDYGPISEVLDNFSDLEKHFIHMMMLGLTAQQIATIKGISEVRVRQLISTIRYNECWSKYGTQEKLNRRRKIRSL